MSKTATRSSFFHRYPEIKDRETGKKKTVRTTIFYAEFQIRVGKTDRFQPARVTVTKRGGVSRFTVELLVTPPAPGVAWAPPAGPPAWTKMPTMDYHAFEEFLTANGVAENEFFETLWYGGEANGKLWE